MKNEMLALILAGGQGTRLGKLTQSIAKPAVQFGGRYRIIDFALSNCANSGIHNVGVVTQYQPLALNNHIGNGSSWGLDGINSGVSILQPYSASEGNRWFEGTSHAIYQNIDYIDSVNPEYVLILSGDHIYKMDYDDMLQSHKDNNASLTVAVLDVPLKEASRFGIMNTDANNRIVEFEEKPAQPKSTKASMGIYIFDWQRLRNMLVAAEKSKVGMSDFGKNVIPNYLESGESVYAYEFSGYWKDVGTIESLWEANMEYISPENALDSRNRQWKIYPDKLSTNITFDVKLAQEIYAACDLFLMPSRFEPCGLSQMMAMRYGTLPLVHEVGGLRDTVRAFNPIEGSGTGFSFDNLSPYWLNWTFQTALDLYRNHPDIWRNLQKQAMESDFSWDTACKSYLDLYHSLVN